MEPPDPAYARQRWIPQKTVAWVKQCNAVLVEHGVVVSVKRYRTRDQARGHVRALKRLMVELRLHQPWQLREHMEKVEGGWMWSLEYLGRSDD